MIYVAPMGIGGNQMIGSGKILAHRAQCEVCECKWIMPVTTTFNLHCISCGLKQSSKKVTYVWIQVEECTEVGMDGSDNLHLLS